MTARRWRAGWLVPVLALIGGGAACDPDAGREAGAEADDGPTTVAGALSGEAEAERYARALGPRPLIFPEDHGPHPDYRHEWWYVTGNVETPQERHFGFQVTFFRFALSPEEVERPSGWASRQLWMAHFAVTDTEGETFHHFERLSRGALELAGARADPFAVWLDDWRMDGRPGEGLGALTVQAQAEGVALELELEALKPIVLQGERGYSRKGSHPGNASYYYTLPRLQAEGAVRLDGERHPVRGTAWMDREWGSSTLEEEQTGWDWLSLQLDDGRELMFYHLRRDDGSIDPRSKGGWVDAQGRHTVVGLDDVELEVLETWTSPDGAATYPARWRLRYPDAGLELEIEPVLADQELRSGFRYWEGAVRARGEAGGEPVSAVGYAELTGYAEAE